MTDASLGAAAVNAITSATDKDGKPDQHKGTRPGPKVLRSANPTRPPSSRVSSISPAAATTAETAVGARPDFIQPAGPAQEPFAARTFDNAAPEAADDMLHKAAPLVVKQIKPFQQPKPAQWPANRQRRDLAFDSPRRSSGALIVAGGGLLAIIALAWFLSSRLFSSSVPAAPAQEVVMPTRTNTPVPLSTLVATIQGTTAPPTVVQAVVLAPPATGIAEASSAGSETETPLAVSTATAAAAPATVQAPSITPPAALPTATPLTLATATETANPSSTPPPAARPTAAPTSTSVAVPSATQAPAATVASSLAASEQTYTVKAGDNCYNIARALGVRLEDLLAINGLETGCTKLSINQVLKLPASRLPTATARTTAPAAPAVTATSQAAIPTATPSLAGGRTYVVLAGDNCYDIAREQNVSLEDLKKVNGLDQRCALKTGQVLVLPTK